MVAKLRLVWQNQILQSVLKPLIFAALLFNVWWLDFSLLAVAIYFIGNFLIYIYPLLNSITFISSFIILLIFSLAAVSLTTSHFWYLLLVIFVLSTLYYLVLGLKNLYLTDKDRWYYFLNLSLFYLTFLLFFVETEKYFLFKIIVVFLANFFLWKEVLKFNINQALHQRTFFALIISLLISELVWVISWLSISFIFAANLTFLAIYLVESLLIKGRN